MRFYEFSPAEPAIKASRRPTQRTERNVAHELRSAPQAPLIPQAVLHQQAQAKLASQIAKSAQNVTPNHDDMAIAFARYAQAQRQADTDFEQRQAEEIKSKQGATSARMSFKRTI